jgi:hypothetical protein
MPKKPPRDNQKYRAFRTVQSAATVLRRISQKTGVVPAPFTQGAGGTSHIDLIRAGLPEELRPHLVTCLLKPAEIVLFAESAAWAARLRVAAVEAAQTGAFSGISGANPRITVRLSPRSAAPIR